MIISQITDAGYKVLNPDGSITVYPGWLGGQTEDFLAAVHVVNGASKIKTPGVGADVLKAARAFIEKELQAHVKSGPGEHVVLLVGG